MGSDAPSFTNKGIWPSGAATRMAAPPSCVAPVHAFVHRLPVFVPASGLSLLSDEAVAGLLELPSGGYAVIRERPSLTSLG
jgi:hypothetical protein